jgi:hypothetical protein
MGEFVSWQSFLQSLNALSDWTSGLLPESSIRPSQGGYRDYKNSLLKLHGEFLVWWIYMRIGFELPLQ